MRHYGGSVVVPPPLSDVYAIKSRPKTGSVVKWDAVPAVDKDADTAGRLGAEIKGVLGNSSHLSRFGGHTPWRQGSRVGPEWAIDVALTQDQFSEVLAELRRGDWDELVRFVNYGGWQYSNDDTFRSRVPSSDDHLHLEYENAAVDYAGPSLLQVALLGEEMDEMDAELIKKIAETHRVATVWIPAYRQEQIARDAAILAAVKGNADPVEVEAAIGKALKAERAGLVSELTPALAAALAPHMAEMDAAAVAEVVEAKLREVFADAGTQ